MKRSFIIMGVLILTALLAGGIYFGNINGIKHKPAWSTEPRAPQYAIPVTYTADWLAFQDALFVDSLRVTVVQSELNMFNYKSLVAYRVNGHLRYKNGWWKPQISAVHIAERIIRDTCLPYERAIEITPLISMVEREVPCDAGTDVFEFTNEHIIKSCGWGRNGILLTCMGRQQVIEIWQDK